MVITPLKRFSSSIINLGFGIDFCDLNNCKVLLTPLRASIQSLLTDVSISWNKLWTTPTSHGEKETIKKECLTFGELNMVMCQLGFQQCCGEDGSVHVDILSVFDEEEPSLGEVQVAFEVFDENSDGFIDEFELKKMLSKFGHPENAKLEQCRNMIKWFDVNGDGVIDFEEFVRLMETCF